MILLENLEYDAEDGDWRAISFVLLEISEAEEQKVS
jgi:hypothetical protein